MASLTALDIADDPSVWVEVGFSVTDSAAWIDGVAHRLGGPGRGIAGWSLFGVDLTPGQHDIDGLPTVVVDDVDGQPTPAHANGVTGLDHVVVASPDHARTVAEFERVGLSLLRVRETYSYGSPMRQGFFRLGPVILELVGGAEPSGDGPATFLGLAWSCADLDATGAWLGPRLHPAKEAVQPGRRIATLDREAGSTVSMAFMSAEPHR